MESESKLIFMDKKEELLKLIETKLLTIFMCSEIAKSKIIETLKPTDFSDNSNRIIFQAINELYNQGKAINNIILLAYLNNIGKLEKIINAKEYIDKMYNEYIGDEFFLSYIDFISENSRKIKLKSLAQFIDIQLKLESNSSQDVLDSVQLKLGQLFDFRSDIDFVHIKTLAKDLYKNIERLSHLDSNITGISSGYEDLDLLTDGFHSGELIILAARPSMGKTALALNIVSNTIRRDYKKDDKKSKTAIAFFSLEMPNIQLMSRLASLISHVPLKKTSTGKNLSSDDWEKLEYIVKISNKVEVYFNDSSSLTVSKIHLKLKNLCKLNPNVKIVIIDYLQLISVGNKEYGQSRQNEISKISRNLKIIARELNISIICLSQLSRAVETREDKRPIMSDLRDSGSIEQDADLVMLMYRESYYQNMSSTHQKDMKDSTTLENNKKDLTELILAKNRNGPIGKVYLQFDSKLGKFIKSESTHKMNYNNKTDFQSYNY